MKKPTFDYKTALKTLPNLPGVYRMRDTSGSVLYVGKALDLKRRVSSYFQKKDQPPRIQLMVRQIADIETTVTRSEVEALILESNLIKAMKPHYNILFRDDKSYPHLTLSRHEYPRLAYGRASTQQQQSFGPYPNGYAVRASIQILQKVFQLRTCEDSAFSHRSRPCLLHQTKHCSAPCVQYISKDDYARDVANAVAFLQGRKNELIGDLTDQMMTKAEAMEFEKATTIRNQIHALVRAQEKQFVSSNSSHEHCDVVAAVQREGMLCVNLVMIRNGQHLGDKSYFPVHGEASEITESLEAFLTQHYRWAPFPSTVILNGRISNTFRQHLEQQATHKLAIKSNPIGERRAWLKMAEKNAELAITQRISSKKIQHYRLAELNAILELDGATRFDCFDISHTMGEATVAACVVYDKQRMQPGEYRRYNIEIEKPGDDYAAMRAALSRHYEKLAASKGKLPDAVLIDGGKGQVGVALKVLTELGLNLPVVGISKGEKRKPGLETLILPHLDKVLKLRQDHPALHLIQTVRDEAHRFAITGHRSRRAKARASTLEAIPGVGAKRRQKLLMRFGGLRGVAAASAADLAQVDGIGNMLAEKIHNALH